MLRLRPFTLHHPVTLADALRLLGEAGQGGRIIAGGTDLLPNMKLHRLDAEVLISLARLDGFDSVAWTDRGVRLGAGLRLADLASDVRVGLRLPVLAQAAARVAGPQIRNMATVGGNVCLDTRCRYINQGELFRQALGGCLKSHGDVCHVVPDGKGCVAALSSDLAPALLALQATAHIVGPTGARSCPMGSFYNTDGLHHIDLAADEILVAIEVPLPGPEVVLAGGKWAVRRSIDFPLLNFCLRLDLDSTATSRLNGGLLVVGVLGPRPRQIALDRLAGASLDADLADRLAAMAFSKCKPLANVPGDPVYRRRRLAVEVKRAALALAATAAGASA